MSSSVVDAQVILLELNPTMLPLVDLASTRRVTSSSRHCRRRSLGDPPPLPHSARVSPHVRRGQRKEMVGSRRYHINRTAPNPTYPFGLPSCWPADPACRRTWTPSSRPACVVGPAAVGFWAITFFQILYCFPDLFHLLLELNVKENIKCINMDRSSFFQLTKTFIYQA
jgi:hypothetical protein